MSIDPEQISVANLPRSRFGGISEEAADELLRRVAWDYREAVEDRKKLARTVEQLGQRTHELEDLVTSLQEAIASLKESEELTRTLLPSARQAAREQRESVRRDCELMLRKARARASRIEEEAKRRTRATKAELAELEALRARVVDQLRSTLESVTALARSATASPEGELATATEPSRSGGDAHAGIPGGL